MTTWPLFHIVNEPSRRNLLQARGAGATIPELPQHPTVRAWDREPSREVERLMRERPGVERG